MNPFKKKNKQSAQATIQTMQNDFNQTMFELGKLYYQKSVIQGEIAKLSNLISSHVSKGEKLAQDATKLNAKAQEELKAAIKQGEEVSAPQAS